MKQIGDENKENHQCSLKWCTTDTKRQAQHLVWRIANVILGLKGLNGRDWHDLWIVLKALIQYSTCSFVTQDLRKKNWKAMEALNDAEKNTQAQINKALEAAKVLRTFCHSLDNINIS